MPINVFLKKKHRIFKRMFFERNAIVQNKFIVLPDQDAEVLSTEMSVTSGGPPAVILEIGVAISTFPIIEAKTGNLESTLASLSLH